MKKVIIRKTEEIENWRRNINSEINFIPTMGNLHDGHIKLISTAKNDNSNINLVSIFIIRWIYIFITWNEDSICAI